MTHYISEFVIKDGSFLLTKAQFLGNILPNKGQRIEPSCDHAFQAGVDLECLSFRIVFFLLSTEQMFHFWGDLKLSSVLSEEVKWCPLGSDKQLNQSYGTKDTHAQNCGNFNQFLQAVASLEMMLHL